MDKSFHDLLVRYVNGNCTEKEIEKINLWFEKIADMELHLDEEEKKLMRTRMLANIQNALPDSNEQTGNDRYRITHSLLKVAAAITVVAVCGLWLLVGNDSFQNTGFRETTRPSGEIIIQNQTSTSRRYALPDGSTVQLEPSGKMHVSKNFLAGKREVYLTGKAFFDIVKNTAQPFYVYSGTVATRVFGTSFFVDAPAGARKVEVKVVTGQVWVFQIGAKPASQDETPSAIHKSSSTHGVVLSRNQKVEYFIEEDHWVTGLVENPVALKFNEEDSITFVFENTPMKAVLADVNERYGVEVLAENEKIYACTFTGDVSRMSLYDMLDVISNSIGSTYEVKGTRILVSGKGCD